MSAGSLCVMNGKWRREAVVRIYQWITQRAPASVPRDIYSEIPPCVGVCVRVCVREREICKWLGCMGRYVLAWENLYSGWTARSVTKCVWCSVCYAGGAVWPVDNVCAS